MDTTIYQRPVELLQKLIRFDTTNPPGNERECIHYIEQLIRGVGMETILLGEQPERPNLISRLKGRGNAPPLLLYGHVDVVPTHDQMWDYPAFEGLIIDKTLWGRGTLDMKGGVAMMLAAFMRAKAEGIQPAGDLIFCALSDEEAHGTHGAKYLVEEYPEYFEGIKYAIGEFGGFPIYIGQHKFYLIQVAEKQLCQLKLTIHGGSGHGAVPLRGGVMAQLGYILKQLDQYPLPIHINLVVKQMLETIAHHLPEPMNAIFEQIADPTMSFQTLEGFGSQGRFFESMIRNVVNPTIVSGGTKINVIPSEVTLQMDGRLLPGFTADDMVTEVRQIIGNTGQLEILHYEPVPTPMNMDKFDLLASVLKAADPDGTPIPYLMPAVTDGRHFAKLGIQTYGYLPLNLPPDMNPLQMIHAANERVPVKSIEFGTNVIYDVIRQYQ